MRRAIDDPEVARQSFDDRFSQVFHPFACVGKRILSLFYRQRKSQYTGNIFRGRSQTALLSAAEQVGTDIDSGLYVKSGDTLGRVDLVSADRVEVDAEIGKVYFDLPHCLHAVGMKDHVRPNVFGYFTEFFDIVYTAGLVVYVHNGNKRGIFCHKSAELVLFYAPELIHGTKNDVETALF